jgi:multidrug resistance efflux pump
LPLRQAILEAKAQIERQQRQEQELQVQETQSVKAVNDAQIQWMDFSRRLDELERSVPIESTR